MTEITSPESYREERKPLSIDLLTKELFIQKLEYIHYNPVTAGLCSLPEEYYYSSAKFYIDGSDSFGMLTHFSCNQDLAYATCWPGGQAGALQALRFLKCKSRTPALAEISSGITTHK